MIQLRLGAVHLVKLPGFIDNAPKVLQNFLGKNPSISQYINNLLAAKLKANVTALAHKNNGQACHSVIISWMGCSLCWDEVLINVNI